MMAERDIVIGVWRRRRARLRRMVRDQFLLAHDLGDTHHAVCLYRQAGALIRRSVSRAGRVAELTFNVTVFSAQESLSTFRFLFSGVGWLTTALHPDAVPPLRR